MHSIIDYDNNLSNDYLLRKNIYKHYKEMSSKVSYFCLKRGINPKAM